MPLKEKSIRLLKIHPERRGDNIACVLNQYDNNIPPYDALSYCWGDSKSRGLTKAVYLNDTLVEIHKTLWEFLDQMRQSGRTENWIWIDFLCLNQLDHSEMSQQIRRMGDIYSEAERVLSWLGRRRSSDPQQDLDAALRLIASKVADKRSSGPQQDLEGALELITNIVADKRAEEALGVIARKVADKRAAVQRFFAQPNLRRWTNVRKTTQEESHILDVLRSSEAKRAVAVEDLPKAIPEVIHLSQGHMFEPIKSILDSPYWERAWITQEVALAQRVVLMFGDATLDFDDFFLAYRAYFYYMMKHWKKLNGELRVPIEARAAVQEQSITFQQVMRWGRDCKASKDVDRIYGLLGLLARCGNEIDALPPILTGAIDYTRKLNEVYWEIALTYCPLDDTSSVVSDRYRSILAHWVNFIYDSAPYFSCPISSQSLQYAASERAPQSCRNMARTALRVIDLCTSAMRTDIGIRIHALPDDKSCRRSSWLTKPCTRQLWPQGDPDEFRDFQKLLGTLFIETDESQCMDENDEYRAVYMGLKMLEIKRWEGEWECEPRQSKEGPLVHNRSISFECQVTTPSSQFPELPCSSNPATSGALPFQESHQCKTQDRYLVIQSTGWRLSLEGLRPFGMGYEKVRVGRLTVKY